MPLRLRPHQGRHEANADPFTHLQAASRASPHCLALERFKADFARTPNRSKDSPLREKGVLFPAMNFRKTSNQDREQSGPCWRRRMSRVHPNGSAPEDRRGIPGRRTALPVPGWHSDELRRTKAQSTAKPLGLNQPQRIRSGAYAIQRACNPNGVAF